MEVLGDFHQNCVGWGRELQLRVISQETHGLGGNFPEDGSGDDAAVNCPFGFINDDDDGQDGFSAGTTPINNELYFDLEKDRPTTFLGRAGFAGHSIAGRDGLGAGAPGSVTVLIMASMVLAASAEMTWRTGGWIEIAFTT